MVRMLVVELGASVDTINDAGFAALYLAAEAGHANTVRLLVKELGATGVGGQQRCRSIHAYERCRR